MTKLKIGILNAYDARNRGDQAIVLCQIGLLRRKFPHAEFLVFSRHAATNSPVLDNPSVESVESLLHVPPAGNFLIRLLHPLWDMLRWWLGARSGKFGKFRSCDLYAPCGGGYLYSSHSPVISRNLACICLEILFAVGTGRPVFQFPQSFGPITKSLDRWLVFKVCRALSHLTPRSQVDFNQLAEWGFGGKGAVVPDTVLSMHHLLPELYPATAARTGLGVAPVNYTFAMKLTGAEHVKYVNDLAEVCRWYHQRTGETIHLFTQVCLPGDDDSVVVNELAAKLKDLGVPFNQVSGQADLKTYMTAMGGVRALVGARMHACIFALTARVPVIGLAYQPKFKGLFGLFGLENWVKPLNEWSVDWACGRLSEILNPTTSPIGQIEARITDLEHQLSDYMDRVLPDGGNVPAAARPRT
jgi:polysaccharide pyruvyl transferase WcaK-like protein